MDPRVGILDVPSAQHIPELVVPAVIRHFRLLVSKAFIGSPTTPALQQCRSSDRRQSDQDDAVTPGPTAGIP